MATGEPPIHNRHSQAGPVASRFCVFRKQCKIVHIGAWIDWGKLCLARMNSVSSPHVGDSGRLVLPAQFIRFGKEISA